MKIRMVVTRGDYLKGEEYVIEETLGHKMSGGGECCILEYDTPKMKGRPMANHEPVKTQKDE